MLSTVWAPQRGSCTYPEKRRKKQREVIRIRKEGIKRRETDPASNQFLKCSPQSGTQRFTELGREEKGEGGDRGDLGEKKESQKGERIIKLVITFLSKNGY